MKNIIKYYYGLDAENITLKDGNYKLVINSNNYLLCKCIRSELLSIIKYIPNNYKFHTIVNTLNGDISITLNNSEYALLKLNMPYKKINITDIYEFNYPVSLNNNSINKWVSLWSNHIDYIEYQINELLNKYPLLSKYIYYYIGLSETAIEFLKTFKEINTSDFIMHKRIDDNMTLVDLYNPVTLVIDSRARDISEYYKFIFFKENYDTEDLVDQIFNSIKTFNSTELKLFLARMIYPTYFFDAYDKIIGFGCDEDIIIPLVNKAEEYEKILVRLYDGIKKATHIENIEWLNQLR